LLYSGAGARRSRHWRGRVSVFTVKDWRGSGAGVLARVHQLSIIVGLVAFAWFVSQWNLLGWQY